MSKPIVVIACMLSSSESWEPQTAPTSLALTCRWRSRPQHQHATYAAQQIGGLFDRPRRGAGGSRNGTLWNLGRRIGSLWLDVGRPDHLGPLLSFFGDQLAEIGGRARKHRTAFFSETAP